MSSPVPWRQAQAELEARWSGPTPRCLACDYDGTLTPLVARPESAYLAPERQARLARLGRLSGVKLAIISGRELGDVQRRVGLPEVTYVGNHGWQIQGPDFQWQRPLPEGTRAALCSVAALACDAAPGCPGLTWEDKQFTGSLHFRNVTQQRHPEVERWARAWAQSHRELKLHAGNRVWEFRPAADWNKATAVAWLLERWNLAAERSLYLGDDLTDEDVFQRLPSIGSVQVGSRRPTAARFSATDPEDVAELLAWLEQLG